MLKRVRNAAVLLVIGAMSVLLYGGTAHADPTPTPIAIEVLTPRAAFTDGVAMQTSLKLDGHGTEVIKSSDASHVVTTKVTVQPGAQIPWHTHHGPVFVTIGRGRADLCGVRGLCRPALPGRDRIRRSRTRPRAHRVQLRQHRDHVRRNVLRGAVGG